MRELQNRQRIKRRIYSIPALILLLFVTFALVRGAYGLMLKERQAARDAEELKQSVAELTARGMELRDEIERLNTSAGREEEIKSKFNVARPGESVAVIVDRPSGTSTDEETKPWYKRFWDTIRYAILAR